MSHNTLTLYRRHRTGEHLCKRNYQQDARPFKDHPEVYRIPLDPPTEKRYGILRVEQPPKDRHLPVDCECPIVADGSLAHEPRRIRYRSVNKVASQDTTDFDTAITIAAGWIKQQCITPSLALAELHAEPDTKREYEPDTKIDNPPVRQAFEKFIGDQKYASSTERAYNSLFRDRIYPFCDKYEQDGKPRPIRTLRKLVELQQQFFDMPWKSLPRYAGDPHEGEALPYKRFFYRKWRHFLHYCVDEAQWLDKMPPKLTSIDDYPSNSWRGLLPLEMERVKAEAYKKLEHARRSRVKKAVQQDILIIELLEELPMRISEPVTLAQENLIRRPHENGDYILRKFQYKLRRKRPIKKTFTLEVPISNELVAKLEAYVRQYGYAGTDADKHLYPDQTKDYHYFFWNPQSTKHATGRIMNFEARIRDYIILAQKPRTYKTDRHGHGHIIEYAEFQEPFNIPEASSHDFRHGVASAIAPHTPPQNLMALLGHADLKMAMNYVNRTPEQIKILGDVLAKHKARFKPNETR